MMEKEKKELDKQMEEQQDQNPAATDSNIEVKGAEEAKPAVKEAIESREHIELIDFNRLTSLWQEYYPKMNDEKKNLLQIAYNRISGKKIKK